MAEIFGEKTRKTHSLKIKISKIGIRHVLSWLKLGLEPKFHEPGTFGGFRKREQSCILHPVDFLHWTIWGPY